MTFVGGGHLTGGNLATEATLPTPTIHSTLHSLPMSYHNTAATTSTTYYTDQPTTTTHHPRPQNHTLSLTTDTQQPSLGET